MPDIVEEATKTTSNLHKLDQQAKRPNQIASRK